MTMRDRRDRSPVTRTQARHLAFRARHDFRWSASPDHPCAAEYACPLAVDAEPHIAAHRVIVWRKNSSADRPTPAEIDDAFINHLTDSHLDTRCYWTGGRLR